MVCHEVMILPEMLEAGVQALEEGKGYTPDQLVVAIYLAMRGIEEIAVMHEASGTRH